MKQPRCKAGDVAVIIKSSNGNEGMVVTCLMVEYYLTYKEWVWEIDTDINCTDFFGKPKKGRCIIDSFLRPLRDPKEDEEDEMIKLLGKPTENQKPMVHIM